MQDPRLDNDGLKIVAQLDRAMQELIATSNETTKTFHEYEKHKRAKTEKEIEYFEKHFEDLEKKRVTKGAYEEGKRMFVIKYRNEEEIAEMKIRVLGKRQSALEHQRNHLTKKLPSNN